VAVQDELYAYDGVNRLVAFDRGDLNANKDALSGTAAKEEDWTLDMTGNWSNFLQKTSGSESAADGMPSRCRTMTRRFVWKQVVYILGCTNRGLTLPPIAGNIA
jgi:hypothetical protein